MRRRTASHASEGFRCQPGLAELYFGCYFMAIPQVASTEQLEIIGRIAADRVKDGQIVGLGSGKAAQAFVRALGGRVHESGLRIEGVPTSELTASIARQCGVPLVSLSQIDRIDLDVDGADEVTPELNLLKGGGGNLLREKVIASIARELIVVVGEEKLTPRLGTRFPVFVEVVEFALPVVQRRLRAMGARTADARKNPDGSMFHTDNGNPLVHAQFPVDHPLMAQPEQLEVALRAIAGTVETGLFINYASEVIIAMLDGSVESATAGHRRKIIAGHATGVKGGAINS